MKRIIPSWLPSKEKKEKVALALIVKGVALILPKCLRMKRTTTMRVLLMRQVKDADTAKDTKHGYRLSLQQSIMFIFLKKGKNKEENKDAMYRVLHKDLVADLRKVKGGSTKTLYARHQAVAMAHILRAGPEYHRIDLLQLDPHVFLLFLLSITNAKNKEYNKSYGGHGSVCFDTLVYYL
jgi:hypothetical protein